MLPLPKIQTVQETEPQMTKSAITAPSENWKTADFGIFTYEYPSGWHVAELWGDGTNIAIDPKPIRTSPRGGGPIATFEINVLNGNQNPDEILAKNMETFNEENYDDIYKESIKADIGDIYYYKGKVPPGMYEGANVEKYFFTFKRNPDDPINQFVVTASLTFHDDPQLSEMLRHIVTSFKLKSS